MAINNYKYQKPKKIDWLNAIPTHWDEVRLGSLFNQRKEKVSDTDYPPLSVTKNGVVPQLDNAAKSNDGDNRKLVLKGDFAINSRSDRKGSSGVSIYDGSVSLIYIVLKPIKIEPRYSEYLLKSFYFKEEYYRYGRGIVADLWTTRYSEMKNMIIPYAPLSEQTLIANFLDYKLEKIERFITKKKQLIELLREQKVAVINQAVTKGLNTNAKLKSSGIEWLGNIPEDWKVVKLTGVCSFVRGNSSFKKDELLSKGQYVALQYGKTYKVDEVNEQFEFYVNDEFYKVSQIVNFGDVIIISTSETIEDLGHSVFYNRSDLGLLGGEQLILKPNNKIVFEKYLYYSSKIFTKELKKYATGVKVYRFNISDLKTIYTSVPTIQEQKQIVDYIEKELSKIDKTISTIEKEITLVEEYKTALIAEAVTGKIDVRDFKIPEIEEPLAMVAEEAENYNKAN
jgi:type I restriction enzyme S subunit